MQSYLFVGGAHDGLNISVEDDLDEVGIRGSVAGSEPYIRDTLAIGRAAVVIFRYVNLTPAQALDRLVSGYSARLAGKSRKSRWTVGADGDLQKVRSRRKGAPTRVSEFTKDQLYYVSLFLAQIRDRAKPSREELSQCSQSQERGDAAWSEYGISATDVQTARWWYQRRREPGSNEWRPAIILRALVRASERDYTEPELMPVDDAALNSIPAQRKRARKEFIRKHGVAAFYQRVHPIIADKRRGGMKRLLMFPATPEIREYVKILETIARR